MRWLLFVCVVAACGGGSSSECTGLALADCRLADGCQVDSCFACSCTPAFRGCVAAGASTEPCPDLGCPQPPCCDTQADCLPQTTCAAPGTPPGCGPCNTDPSTCTDDAECQQSGPMICEPITCSCDGNTACVPGCTANTDCDEGLSCDLPAARCRPTACATELDCPSNFACTGGGCARATCSDDLDCDGFCVEGSCFEGRGECVSPVP